VGTRESVMSHLVAVGEVADASGMASTALAEAIGYPGSSVAFAQLLSGMERSGLIVREVRGKRTYRIVPAPAAARGGPALPAAGGRAGAAGTPAGPAAGREAGRASAAAPGGGGRPTAAARRDGPRDDTGGSGHPGLAAAAAAGADVDYDELARRLLVQVIERLAASPADDRAPGGDGPAPGAAGPGNAGPGNAALAKTVASLEQKLASVQSKQRRLTAENAKLREQLRAAEQSLAQAQERDRAGRAAGRFDTAEVLLLERLLSPLRDQGGSHEEAGAG
jgi:hypothetical protein